jgi:hypothetical protein
VTLHVRPGRARPPLTRRQRERIARAIEMLVAVLDDDDGGADLKPDLGWTTDGVRGGADDREDEDEHGSDADDTDETAWRWRGAGCWLWAQDVD